MVNYVPEPIRISVSGFKDKVVSLFKTNTPKQTVYKRGTELSKPKTRKPSEENIKNRNLFMLKKENKEIEDRIISDIRIIFEQHDYYKLEGVSNSWNIMMEMMMEIKNYL